MPLFHRNFVRHRLNRRQLIFPAEGHQNRARTDGRIEAFGKTPTGTDIEVTRKSAIGRVKIRSNLLFKAQRSIGCDFNMLFRAVGI